MGVSLLQNVKHSVEAGRIADGKYCHSSDNFGVTCIEGRVSPFWRNLTFSRTRRPVSRCPVRFFKFDSVFLALDVTRGGVDAAPLRIFKDGVKTRRPIWLKFGTALHPSFLHLP